MNRAVKLNPLTTLLALTIGAVLQGLLGALLAVPAAAVVQVFVVRVLVPWIRRTTDGAAQEVVDQNPSHSDQTQANQREDEADAAAA